MLNDSLLDIVYAIVAKEEAQAELLSRLAHYFRCNSAALLYGDPNKPAADIVLNYGVFDEEARARYMASYAAIDPAPAAMAALPVGKAAATDRLFTPEERATSRFLLEFYHPLGLYEALGAPIARADGKFGILAVHRGRDRPPFDDSEIEAFGQIATHVARAVALRSRFFAVERLAKTRADMLDGVAAGVLVVDPLGQLVEANLTAREILGRNDGLALTRSGRIRVSDKTAEVALGAVLAGRSRTPAIIAASRKDSARPYALKVERLGRESGRGAETWLIHIADDRAPAVDIEHTLEQALRLTSSSAAVVAALLRGEDLNSYAKRAGISQNTVKFHLKGAFRATATRRQSDLIRLAASTLRDLSA